MIFKKGISADEKANVLLRELSRLKEERKDFEADWEEAQKLVSSVVFHFSQEEDDAAKRYELPRRITSRPSNYLETLKAGILGYFANPNITWLKLRLTDRDLEDEYGVRDWLQECEAVLYKSFNVSNLYSALPAFVEYACVFGQSLMLVEEDILNYKAIYGH